MNLLHTRLFTLGLLATLTVAAVPAMAHMDATGQPGHEHRGPRMDKMHEHMAARHQQHLTELKGKLHLQAAQEASWNTFVQAMQAPAAAGSHPDRAALLKLSTPERVDHMETLHAQHGIAMKKRGEAAKAFYATLSEEQKKTFDAETGRFMGGAQGMRGRH